MSIENLMFSVNNIQTVAQNKIQYLIYIYKYIQLYLHNILLVVIVCMFIGTTRA